MATYELTKSLNGINSYTGSTGADTNDIYVVNASRSATSTTPFLSGTYYIDTNGSGNDTLVFKITDVFKPGTNVFLPQIDINGNTATFYALDQRSGNEPLNIVWSNFNSADKVQLQFFETGKGKLFTIENTAYFINNGGSSGTYNNGTGAVFAKHSVIEPLAGYESGLDDPERKYLGTFYVANQDFLASTASIMPYNGMNLMSDIDADNRSDANHSFEQFIFNEVKSNQNEFSNSNSKVQQLDADIVIDRDSLSLGRRYLDLVGSIGVADSRSNNSNFTSVIEDVQYKVFVDMSATNGVTVRETNTGLRDWSDEVAYTELGITSSGNSGLVNFGAPNSPSGLTLTTGNFNGVGVSASKLRVIDADTPSANSDNPIWISLSSVNDLNVGDKLIYQTQSHTTVEFNSGEHYRVTDIDFTNQKIQVSRLNDADNEPIATAFTVNTDSTFQKLEGYDTTVNRGGATDVFSGFRNFTLSSNADTIDYWGGEYTSIAAGQGNDVWNIRTQDLQNNGWTQLKIETEDWGSSITGATKGVLVNLSGKNQSFGPTNLTGNKSTSGSDVIWQGQMSDEFGSIDTLNFYSGESYSDDLHLTLTGTSFGDRYWLSADGLKAVSEYRIEASSGFDHYFLNSDANGSLSNQVGVISTNLPPFSGTNSGYAQIEGYSRFYSDGDYKVSFSNVTVGSSSKLVASLKQTASINLLNASGQLSVDDADHWKVGETIVYRAGAGAVTGLTDGASYKISEVQTNDASGTSRALIKLTAVNGSAVTLSVADVTTEGSTFERIASTGTVDSNFVTFEDDVGNFSKLALKVDGKITAETTMRFEAQANVRDINFGTNIWSDDSLAESANRADFAIDYRNVYDTAPPNAERAGIQYINGMVHKGALGFDRFVDYADTAYVGTRSYSMTEYNDVMIQSTGSAADILTLAAGRGQDKIYVESFNSDANDLIQIRLGENEWSQSSDGDYDQVEIGLSRLSKDYGNVQYIYISEADQTDSIKFVDAEGYTVVQQSRLLDYAHEYYSYLDYITYNIYEGAANDDNLVMSVQMMSDRDSTWSKSQDVYAAYTNWGTTSADGRSISGNPVPVAMTINNDAALLFEDSALALSPYLMGAGDDYVISMGGDQDIGLGAGDDYISVRNYGQQLFVSGGLGNDSIGLSGNYNHLSNGTVVSDQWSFSSIDVSKAQEFLSAKYPTVTADKFEWATGALDRVMQATNRLDGTTIYFQAEKLSFSNGSINAEEFLPPIVETYDTTSKSLASTTLFGRSTNDTINLKVSDVDFALKHIGSWLDSTTTPLLTTGSTLVGSHTLEIKAQSTVKWFTGDSSTYTNGGFKLVDIENIRLFDNNNNEVTIRVAGSNGYSSVYEAVQSANRGDVIFIAETREGLQTGTTRAAVNMDTTVDIDSGLRVAFEEQRTTIPQFTVNMTSSVKTSESDKFFGNNTHALELLGTANVNINGSNVSDLIIGNKGNNVINGQSGNDIIFGGNGSDIVIGGSGNDALIGGSSHRAVAIQHTAQDGIYEGFDPNTNTFRINNTSELEFKTGDKIIYQASGGTGIQALIGGTQTTLTSTTPLYVIRTDLADGTSLLKLASTEANARNGTYIDIVSNGTATNHSMTLDIVAYSTSNLPGNDYLYGGSGNDTLIATGVMGSLLTTNTKDTLTMNGGSGNDTFALFGNSGQINMFGGSGADKLEVYDNFMDVAGTNKGARMVDFAAAQDDLLAAIDTANLGSMSIETKLNNGGLTLSQLVSPPLPIVNGSAENGNFQQINDDKVIGNYALEIDNYQLNVADLVNQHNAHAA